MSANADISLHVVQFRATDNYRYLINFNLPVDQLSTTLGLDRIRNYIHSHFFPKPDQCVSCRFQVTATYILKRPDIDNAERLWSGSFFNSDNNQTVLSGLIWRDFDPATFVGIVQGCTTPDHVENILNWQDTDTVWSFDRLVSIIVSFQTVVRLSNDRYHRTCGFGGGRRIIQLHNW